MRVEQVALRRLRTGLLRREHLGLRRTGRLGRGRAGTELLLGRDAVLLAEEGHVLEQAVATTPEQVHLIVGEVVRMLGERLHVGVVQHGVDARQRGLLAQPSGRSQLRRVGVFDGATRVTQLLKALFRVVAQQRLEPCRVVGVQRDVAGRRTHTLRRLRERVGLAGRGFVRQRQRGLRVRLCGLLRTDVAHGGLGRSVGGVRIFDASGGLQQIDRCAVIESRGLGQRANIAAVPAVHALRLVAGGERTGSVVDRMAVLGGLAHARAEHGLKRQHLGVDVLTGRQLVGDVRARAERRANAEVDPRLDDGFRRCRGRVAQLLERIERRAERHKAGDCVTDGLKVRVLCRVLRGLLVVPAQPFADVRVHAVEDSVLPLGCQLVSTEHGSRTADETTDGLADVAADRRASEFAYAGFTRDGDQRACDKADACTDATSDGLTSSRPRHCGCNASGCGDRAFADGASDDADPIEGAGRRRRGLDTVIGVDVLVADVVRCVNLLTIVEGAKVICVVRTSHLITLCREAPSLLPEPEQLVNLISG